MYGKDKLFIALSIIDNDIGSMHIINKRFEKSVKIQTLCSYSNAKEQELLRDIKEKFY